MLVRVTNEWFSDRACWFSFFSHFRMHFLFAILLLGFQVQGNALPALNKVWEEWKVKHSKRYDNQVGFYCHYKCRRLLCGDSIRLWVCMSASDRDGLQEGGVGAQRAAGASTQPGGLGGEARLHPGAQSPGWHGEEAVTFMFWQGRVADAW